MPCQLGISTDIPRCQCSEVAAHDLHDHSLNPIEDAHRQTLSGGAGINGSGGETHVVALVEDNEPDILHLWRKKAA